MLNITQAIVLGLLQGASELFPISSLGHSVLVPAILRWHINESSDAFVSFVVLTHLATALALLAFFFEDWVRIISGMWRSFRERSIAPDDTYAKIGWLLVVSSIPAGLLGITFEKIFQGLFSAVSLVAIALMLNGVMLFIAEALRTRSPEGDKDDAQVAGMTWKNAVLIGFAQCLALVPGFSRTGAAMTGGLMNGLSHENSARFAFLLATPIIFAASVLKVPVLFTQDQANLLPALLGALCAALTAYLSVRFLVKYFKAQTLRPFAAYCIAAGAFAFLLLR